MEILKIREHGDMVYKVAEWFNSKWGVPVEAYEGSVPQWYVVLENDVIIGGIGVIENDFHDRTDLTPNICALYVEKEHRDKGIAGNLLEYVCDDMSNFRSPRAIFTTQTILI
ncbi:MAG: GNAT family N-acetyltransferase [Peptostreptococcaceae bacterium]